MGYKKICDEGVYEIWYGEGAFLPWRVSIGGSGKYFATMRVVERFVCDACGKTYERGVKQEQSLPYKWTYIEVNDDSAGEKRLVCESCRYSFWSWFESRKPIFGGEINETDRR